jgi:exodeoxyribonuclease-3
MKFITWNVNSITVRAERLLALLVREQPDVLCLQELKCQDDKFPRAAIEQAGYHVVTYGQKTYNGVAIIARSPISDTVRGFGDEVDDPQARLIAGRVQGVHVVCVYVPNGSHMGSDKCAYKLAWYQRLRAWLNKHVDAHDAAIVCGDFNVAPTDKDVARPESWAQSVLCHPDMRAALKGVQDFGLIDVFAKHCPTGGQYSWWDYRNLGFAKNNGLRIDLLLATENLASRSTCAYVDRDERRGERPSDHAPVCASFAWP